MRSDDYQVKSDIHFYFSNHQAWFNKNLKNKPTIRLRINIIYNLYMPMSSITGLKNKKTWKHQAIKMQTPRLNARHVIFRISAGAGSSAVAPTEIYGFVAGLGGISQNGTPANSGG